MRRLAATFMLSAAAAVLAPGLARADLMVVVRVQDGHDETMYYRGDRLRIQDFGDMGPDGALLFDARTKQIVLAYDDSKSFFDLSKAMKQVRPLVARIVAMAPRLFVRPPPVDLRYLPLHEKRNIIGIDCEMYAEFTDGRITDESCYAPLTDALGTKKEWHLVGAVLDAMFYGLFNKPLAAMVRKTTGDQPPGLAIWGQEIRPDRTRGAVWELRSLKTEPIPAELFSLPPDYHEVAEPLDPPRDGAERQRALRLARMSPRDEGTSMYRYQVTGVIAFGLAVILALALFVHAFFLHLAAGWVIPEARFIKALVATGVVWMVTLPLELLHVWPPAELAVGALAVFAGLELGYRSSTARTLALFVIATALALAARFLLAGGIASLLSTR